MVSPMESLREELGLSMITQLKSYARSTATTLVLNSGLGAIFHHAVIDQNQIWCQLVMIVHDDAFSANHPRILTPFTKAQLKKQKRASFDLYMRLHSHLNELKSSAFWHISAEIPML